MPGYNNSPQASIIIPDHNSESVLLSDYCTFCSEYVLVVSHFGRFWGKPMLLISKCSQNKLRWSSNPRWGLNCFRPRSWRLNTVFSGTSTVRHVHVFSKNPSVHWGTPDFCLWKHKGVRGTTSPITGRNKDDWMQTTRQRFKTSLQRDNRRQLGRRSEVGHQKRK